MKKKNREPTYSLGINRGRGVGGAEDRKSRTHPPKHPAFVGLDLMFRFLYGHDKGQQFL